MDFNKVCRCCLADDMELTNIITIVNVGGQVETLADSLTNCLNVVMIPNDGFPQNICEDCLNQIHSILCFKTTVINSREKILKQFERNKGSQSYFKSTENDVASARQSFNEIKTDEVYREDSCGDYETDCSSSELNESQTYPIKEKVEVEIEYGDQCHSSKQTPQMYYCTFCDSSFSESKDLSMHCLNEHKQDKVTGRICSYCTERFDDQKSLDRHQMRHLTPFLCDGCLKSFSNSSTLEAHTGKCILLKAQLEAQTNSKSNESEAQERVVCPFCGKSYVSSYIKKHMLLHGDEYKYKCKNCSKSFKSIGSLKSHIIFNHNKEKNHRCQFCDLEFKTASKKTLHIRNQHFKEKNVDCPTCGKKFFSSAMVKMHMLSHSGEKEHVCHLCNKAYQKRYGLLVHLKSNHV